MQARMLQLRRWQVPAVLLTIVIVGMLVQQRAGAEPYAISSSIGFQECRSDGYAVRYIVFNQSLTETAVVAATLVRQDTGTAVSPTLTFAVPTATTPSTRAYSEVLVVDPAVPAGTVIVLRTVATYSGGTVVTNYSNTLTLLDCGFSTPTTSPSTNTTSPGTTSPPTNTTSPPTTQPPCEDCQQVAGQYCQTARTQSPVSYVARAMKQRSVSCFRVRREPGTDWYVVSACSSNQKVVEHIFGGS